MASKQVSTPTNVSNDLHKAVLKDDYNKTPKERGIKPNEPVRLYVWNADTSKERFIGTATVCAKPSAQDEFRTVLHGHNIGNDKMALEKYQPPRHGYDEQAILALPYNYSFNCGSEPAPTTLADLRNIYFIWDTRAMRIPRVQGADSHTTEQSRDDPEIVDDSEIQIVEEEIDTTGVQFRRKTYNRDDYNIITVTANISQIRDFSHPLRPVDENHANMLKNKFLDPAVGYQQAAGLMSITVLQDDLKEGQLSTVMLESVQGGVPRIRDGHTATIVDGRHRRKALTEIAAMDGDANEWARQPFNFSLITRKDNATLSHWEVLITSNTRNTSTSLVRQTTTVVDLLTSIMSYANIFQQTYKINYSEARNVDIVGEMLACGFLGGMAESTYKKYVRLSKALINYQSVMDYIFKDCSISNAKHGKGSNMSYFTDARLLQSNEETMLLLLKCADAFYKSDDRKKFHPKHFYGACLDFVGALQKYFEKIRCIPVDNSTENIQPPATFSAFLETYYASSKMNMSTPYQTVINNMTNFQYSEGDNGKTSTRILKGAISRLLSKLEIHFFPGNAASTSASKKIVRKLSTRPKGKPTSQSVINLEEDEVVEMPKKKLRRRAHKKPTVEAEQNEEEDEENSRGNRGATGGKKSKGNKTPLTPASNNEEDGDGNFDDSFDASRPPANWQRQHAISLEMNNDHIPPKAFYKNARQMPDWRDHEMEQNWNNEHPLRAAGDENEQPENVPVDPSGYFRLIHIPATHRAHIFVASPHLQYLRTMAFKWGIHGEIYGSRDDSEWTDDANHRWGQVNAANDYLAKSFFSRKKTELQLAGYCILEGMADPIGYPHDALESVTVPTDYPKMSSGQFFHTIHRMFPREDDLRQEENRKDWNPIVNSGNSEKDKRDRDMGIARYSSTKHFLMETLELAEHVHLAQRRAYLDTWIGMLVSMLNLDKDGTVPLYFPKTGGRLLLTGRNAPAQVPHCDFPPDEDGEIGSPGYFVIVTGPEVASLWVCPGSQTFISYSEEERHQLGDVLKYEEISIPANSIFIGHGHLQHAGAGWKGSHCLRYHIYLIPERATVPDAIVILFNRAFAKGTMNEAQQIRANTNNRQSNSKQTEGGRSGRSKRSTTAPNRKGGAQEDNNSDSEDSFVAADDENDDDVIITADDINDN